MRMRALCLAIALLCTGALAQKTKVGYRKNINFEQYKTFTVVPSGMPTDNPLLRDIVQGMIQQEFAKRGLTQVDKGGDLVLVAGGSLVWEQNQQLTTPYLPNPAVADMVFDPSMWEGGNIDWMVESTDFQHGTLALQFTDPKTKQVIWIGTVKQSIDLDNDPKEKTMQLVAKAVTKLIDAYPPKH